MGVVHVSSVTQRSPLLNRWVCLGVRDWPRAPLPQPPGGLTTPEAAPAPPILPPSWPEEPHLGPVGQVSLQ